MIMMIITIIIFPANAVGIATHYGLDGPGIEPGESEVFRTRPQRPGGPPNLL